MGKVLSQFWPLSLQMSFNNIRAVTVNAATNPMGSKTFATRLKIKRCMTLLLSLHFVPRLTTNISFRWSLFRPSTCEETSSSRSRITLGLHSWSLFSFLLIKFCLLLKNSVSLIHPNFNNSTKFLAHLVLHVVFLKNLNSRQYRIYLILLAQHRGSWHSVKLSVWAAEETNNLLSISIISYLFQSLPRGLESLTLARVRFENFGYMHCRDILY